MAAPTEKDDETMPTQKIFKGRVRARMTKTGESYTAARGQLLRKAGVPEPLPPDTTEADADAAADGTGDGVTRSADDGGTGGADDSVPTDASGVSDDAMRRASGKGHAEWFALLDAWGGTGHGHTEIARWLSETHGVPGWWTQSITVAYERARGMRARHQMRDGFSIAVTRTVAATAEQALAAFTDPSLRGRWIPDAPMRQRPTRAALSARFDWADPPSRLVVTVVPKGADKSVVAVTHEQLPDAESGGRLKGAWRERLGVLKGVLEGG